MLLADIEDGLMTLSKMLSSQHSVEFRPQVEHWVQRFQELGKTIFRKTCQLISILMTWQMLKFWTEQACK